MVHQPRLRLLDEPTTALDLQTRDRLIGLVQSWARDGDCVVITGHYPEDIEETCTRLVVLKDGKTLGLGTLRDLLGQQGPLIEWQSASASGAVELRDRSRSEIRKGVDRAVEAAGVEQIEGLTISRSTLRTYLRQNPEFSNLIDADNGRN